MKMGTMSATAQTTRDARLPAIQLSLLSVAMLPSGSGHDFAPLVWKLHRERTLRNRSAGLVTTERVDLARVAPRRFARA
ncbi:hypothetical protein OCAE111667_08070 [Occultella aeris]|uniref:Uncharacterized protein n=1 Tax=Occultella aeris TaxID=2761496 RepID=A0A7M4DP12_9MICO|nr:hypothetical protein HALOF300_03893 [Occultella aeris]